jgi:hypothetical protein
MIGSVSRSVNAQYMNVAIGKNPNNQIFLIMC